MGRIFGKGELPKALLVVIATLGEGHGYAIMQALKERVGGRWQPSPGAIYPALLALEERGLLAAEEREGSRVYRLTDVGAAALAEESAGASWASLSARAETAPRRVTLTQLVRDFQADLPAHATALSAEQALRVRDALTMAARQIRELLSQRDSDRDEGETNG
jgi:DNA-binding PadR family transcriptional regulator